MSGSFHGTEEDHMPDGHPSEEFVELRGQQHLHYFLHASGTRPIFTVSCEHGGLLTDQDISATPTDDYEFALAGAGVNFDPAADGLPGANLQHDGSDEENPTLVLMFLQALRYDVRIERHEANHTLIEVVSDKTYRSTDSTDEVHPSITITFV